MFLCFMVSSWPCKTSFDKKSVVKRLIKYLKPFVMPQLMHMLKNLKIVNTAQLQEIVRFLCNCQTDGGAQGMFSF